MSKSDPMKLPVPWRPKAEGLDIEHQRREWTSGTRGGGKLPADLDWPTNPKQYQEENGFGNVPGPHSRR